MKVFVYFTGMLESGNCLHSLQQFSVSLIKNHIVTVDDSQSKGILIVNLTTHWGRLKLGFQLKA